MFKSIKRFVTRTLSRPKTKTKTKSKTTLNDLPEEIIAKILERIPNPSPNEIQDLRAVSRNFNSTIPVWFGTTLAINASRQDFPASLREGHVTILKLKDYTSLGPHDLPPLPRLRELEIRGEMRLQTLVRILGKSPNLRRVFIKSPNILDLDFDVTMVLDELPTRIETLQILIQDNEPEVRVELSLLQIFSQLPLSSLKIFNCIYINGEEDLIYPQIRRESPNNLSFLVRTILTKCRGTLRDLFLSRSYDCPEAPESTPIEKEFKLKKLGLNWVGESRWLRSLIDAQKTRSGLESLIISCCEDFGGVVQEVALASKASLEILCIQLSLNDGQLITDELNLRFLSQFSKLELFDIRSGRSFIMDQGRRTLEEPLAPLILPPTLKMVALMAPITFQTLLSFCALPALEEFTLAGFRWIDYPTLAAILTEIGNGVAAKLTPSILLDWNWFKNLLINCPSLKSIKFFGCVLDIEAIWDNYSDILDKGQNPGFDFKDSHVDYVHLALLNFPNVKNLYAYTTSVRINRPILDRLIPILNN